MTLHRVSALGLVLSLVRVICRYIEWCLERSWYIITEVNLEILLTDKVIDKFTRPTNNFQAVLIIVTIEGYLICSY